MTRSAAPWHLLLLALTAANMIAFGLEAFRPGVIEDDARQFLAWMPRLLDPSLLQGNLIADYWQSVSPRIYRLPFAALAALGVPPTTTARLLPLVLLPLTALAACPVARRLTPDPRSAFLAAALVMVVVVQEGSIFSATPRSVTAPLLLLFLRGLIDDKPLPLLAALLLLALVYPAPAMTCLAMVGLSRIRLAPSLGVALDRRSILIVAAAAAVTLGPVLLFDGGLDRWHPTLSFADIGQVQSIVTPGGRSTIVQANGRIGWLCSPRIGFLPEIISCRQRQAGIGGLVNLLLFLPMAWLAWRSLRRADPADPDRVYALAIAAAVVCWTAAALVMFKLHLPSRYSQRVLGTLEALALGRMVGDWLLARRDEASARFVSAVLFIGLLAAFVAPRTGLKRPGDPALIAAIAALPKGALVAGVAADLNFVPAQTGRAVLATTEHAIPYHLGYYRPFRARLAGSIALVTTTDPTLLAALLRKHKVTAVAVDGAVLATGRLPLPYRQTLPEAVPKLPARPALASAPSTCVSYNGRQSKLFDANCLLMWLDPHSRSTTTVAARGMSFSAVLLRSHLPASAPGSLIS